MVNRLKKRSGHDLDELADTLKSVAHVERLSIIHLLCNNGNDPLEVKDIYNTLKLAQSTTSRHLSIMKKGGLLKREVKRGKTYYGFNPQNDTAVCLKEMLKRS